jgi:hypothetical protein
LLGEIRSSELACAFCLCKLGWPVDERSGFLTGGLLRRIEGIRRLHRVAVVIGVPPLRIILPIEPTVRTLGKG